MLEIEGYSILRQLGSGGMAQVYLAQQRSLGREVALKVLAPERARDPAAAERFLREAQMAARLRHPHIVTIHDVGVSHGVPYIAMEYEPGGTAAPRGGEPLEPAQALRIVREIAGALDYAHAQGVIHRDVKPDNILLRADGSCVLADFGIARAMEGHAPLTREGTSVGTPEYMSPEQLRGEPVDGRADLYSLGVVLFQMLTARLPFTGTDGWAVGMQHLTAPVPRLAPALAHVQPLLDELMAKHADQRPRTGADVVHRIDALVSPAAGALSAAPTSAVPMLAPAPARAARVRRPLLFVLLPLAFLLALTLAWWRPWAQPPREVARAAPAAPIAAVTPVPAPPAPQPSIAVLPFVDLSEARDQEYFADGLAEELLDRLAKVKGLRVVARTSSFSFKGKGADAATIAAALGVQTLLEGSVRKSGDRLRVSTQLVRAADSQQVWSQRYDRDLVDVFEVQEDIAHAVVAALELELLDATPATPAHHVPSPQAYDQYLLGRELSGRNTIADSVRARAAYREAVQLDPDYAAAHAAVAVAEYTVGDGVNYDSDETARHLARQRARAAAARAIELDPTLADGFAARAFIRFLAEWDWQGALADFERALELDPADVDARVRYSRVLASLGRMPEAIAQVNEAIARDPLAPGPWNFLGRYEAARGDLAAARRAQSRLLALHPEHGRAPVDLALIALLDGDAAAALELYRNAADLPFRLMGTAMAEHSLGHADASQRALDELVSGSARGAAYQVAEVYAWRGERDLAFEWLERAVAQRDSGLQYLKYDPALREIRHDPRFEAVIRGIGLPVSNTD